MELKLEALAQAGVSMYAFNRTRMELKPTGEAENPNQSKLLIVPEWN